MAIRKKCALHFSLLFVVALLLGSDSLFAQCSVEASPDSVTITCGDSLNMSAFGNSGNLAIDNDYNAGTPGTGWTATTAATFTNPCSPNGVDGTTHLWMGDASPHPRILETIPLDLTLGGFICFDLLYATQGQAAPCEGPDEPQEGVHLQFSDNSGATWTDIHYFDPLGGYDPILTSWGNYCFPIPAGALLTNARIRWFQDASSGPEYDHWGIDNVQIILNDPTYYYTWPHDGHVGQEPPAVWPRVDTVFTVLYTNGVDDTCSSDVNVSVRLPIITASAGIDTTVCAANCVDLNATAEIEVKPASSPTFENNESQPLQPLGLPTEIVINVAGLNMQTIQSGSLTQVCFNIFDPFGLPPPFPGLDISTISVSLVCPDGNSILLTNSGTGNAYGAGNIITGPSSSTCFSLNAPTTISGGSSPYTGNHLPDNGNSLDDFVGCTANGIWTLQVTNANPLAFGNLGSWSISFDDPAIVTPAQFSWSPTTDMTNENTLNPTVCPPVTTTYTLTIWDNNNCTQETRDVTVNVDQNCCALSIDSIVPTHPTCGASNGGVFIFTSGGAPPVSFSIDNGATTQGSALFGGLTPGTYSILVDDANSCPVTGQVVLVDGGGFQIDSIVTTNPACGNPTGTIDIFASGGTIPVQYSIDNGANYQPSSSFTGLSDGTYQIMIQDGNFCDLTDQVSLTMATGPTIDTLIQTTASCGGFDGEIEVVANGTSQLSYSIDGGVTMQASPIFPGLPAGSYTVIVEDASGCTTNDNVIVETVSSLAIDSVQLSHPTCGMSNATITMWASGGTAPLTYSNDNGNTFNSSGQFANLPPGVYDLIVEDANACREAMQVTLIDQPALVLDTLLTTNPNCGAADGVIDVQILGGTAPFQYSSDNGASFQTSPSLTGLSAGSYQVVVEDSNGCSANGQTTLTVAGGPVIDSVVTTDPSCGMSDGSMVIFANSLNTGLEYSIDNGISFQSSSSFSGLAVSTYNIVVRDITGCSTSDVVTLSNPNSPTITLVDPTNPTCELDNGSINISSNGAALPLLYSIDNGSTFRSGSFFDSLAVGTYNLLVQDANNCTASDQAILSDPGLPQIDSIVNLQPSCGTSNGVIDIFASGGTGSISYSIDSGTTNQTGQTFSNLGSASYDVLITDQAGCQVGSSASLSNIAGPVIDSVLVTHPSCGLANGGLQVFTSSGSAPLQFSIDNGTTNQATSSFSGLNSGNIPILVTDDLGCQAADNAVLDPSTAVTAQLIPTVGCDTGTVQFEVVASGGTPGYTYTWSHDASAIDSFVIQLDDGSYTVTVTDSNGCSATVTEIAAALGHPQVSADVICQGFGISDIVLEIQGSDPFDVHWAHDSTAQEELSGVFAGTYTAQVEDANGCLSDTLEVSVLATDTNLLYIGLDTTINLGQIVKIQGSSSISPWEEIIWTPDDETLVPFGLNATVVPDETTTYVLTTMTEDSCWASDSLTVEVIFDPEEIILPNIFTPNGDGINDNFFIMQGRDMISKIEFQIFDRWGNRVRDFSDVDFEWDGTDTKSEKVDAGVFMYLMEYEIYILRDVKLQKTGDITLVR